MERMVYRDGQRLTARDLRDLRGRDAALRALHVRGLHDTWGIALGLGVTLPTARRSVIVAPGHALDAEGRDLVLAETLELAVPDRAQSGLLVLVARYDTDEAYRDRASAPLLCLGGLNIGLERPAFAWVRAEDLRAGSDVPLVAAVVSAGAIQGGLNYRVRRHARALARPHVGRGATEPGRTGWRQWNQRPNYRVGLQAAVDTSAAGFTRAPYYFATLRGPADTTFGDVGFIANATHETFTFYVAGVRPPFGLAPDAAAAEQAGWTISWLGIEPVRGCEPTIRATRFFRLSGARSLLGVARANEEHA
jgi:hypothetical protein